MQAPEYAYALIRAAVEAFFLGNASYLMGWWLADFRVTSAEGIRIRSNPPLMLMSLGSSRAKRILYSLFSMSFVLAMASDIDGDSFLYFMAVHSKESAVFWIGIFFWSLSFLLRGVWIRTQQPWQDAFAWNVDSRAVKRLLVALVAPLITIWLGVQINANALVTAGVLFALLIFFAAYLRSSGQR